MVIVHKQDQAGRTVTTYIGEIAQCREDSVVIKATWQHANMDLGYTIFETGDEFIEYYYPGRWYNIFEVHSGKDGALKGWYCNITRPPHIEPETIAWQDLWLDVWIMPQGQVQVLDEDEFRLSTLDDATRAAALRALEELRHLVNRRVAPFDQIATDTGTLAG